MPAKGTIGKYHGRHPFLNRALWSKYKKATGSNVSYEEFRDIIEESMEEVKKWVLKDPIGFKLSPEIGNIAINKFKPNFIVNTPTPRGPIRNFNLHTGGNVYKIQWFHAKTTHKSRSPYWFFKACREFNRSLAGLLKSGKGANYNSFMQNHFVNNSECKF